MTDQLKFYTELARLNKQEKIMSEMNIYQRINKVMQEVKYAQKDANIQGYKAVTHDQVVATARHAFVKHGVVITPSQIHGDFAEPANGSKMRLYTGGYVISFVNMDKPEEKIDVTIEAHALDNGDKAPGKCLTYATKSAVLKVLWLETGENDESRAKDLETITQEQADKLIALAQDAGLTEADVCKVAVVDDVTDIQASRYKSALAHFKRLATKEPITNERLAKAIERINSGEFSLSQLHAKFELTEEQSKTLEDGINDPLQLNQPDNDQATHKGCGVVSNRRSGNA